MSVLLERGDPTFGAAASFDEITAAGGVNSNAAAEQQTAWQRITAAAWFPHVVLFVAQVTHSWLPVRRPPQPSLAGSMSCTKGAGLAGGILLQS